MRELRIVQQQFQKFILQNKKNIENKIIGTDTVSVGTRLAIYQDAYFSRLLEALKQDYPVLLALMGKEEFDELGYDYIINFPSHFRSIRWFGEKLSQFIKKRKSHSVSWEAEMANFEWELMMAFDARDALAISLLEMKSVPFEKWPVITFKLHPSVRLLNLSWNIVAAWNAWQDNQKHIAFIRADESITWIIWRKDLNMHFCSLSQEAAYMISAMLDGNNFAMICEGLCQWMGAQEASNHAASLLKGFILDNLITKIIFY